MRINEIEIPDTIDGKPTRNNLGQLIYPTAKGIKNFWRWFGDSKVVDSNGRPLVVYHGTNANFDSFSQEYLGRATGAASANRGFYFARSPVTSKAYIDLGAARVGSSLSDYVAPYISDLRQQFDNAERELLARIDVFNRNVDSVLSDFTKNYDGPRTKSGAVPANAIKKERGRYWDSLTSDTKARMRFLDQKIADTRNAALDNVKTDGANIMPVYLSMKNPLIVDQNGSRYREETYYSIVSRAAKSGHDGVIIKNTYDGGGMDDIYVSFRPEQIKSATGNNGNFSVSSNKITEKYM